MPRSITLTGLASMNPSNIAANMRRSPLVNSYLFTLATRILCHWFCGAHSPLVQGSFFYLYDFGDSWEHEVLVEKVLSAEAGVDYPICIKAKRACPPEDCGGSWGYQEFVEIIQDTEHPEHASMLEWVGGYFDPEDAEFDEINPCLKMIPKDTADFEG